MGKRDAVGKKKLTDMVHLRSVGHTINDTAHRLGLFPWHVGYLTRIIKTCVSTEELYYMEEQAEKHGFRTVGELLMDVFNTSYEHYKRSKAQKKGRKAA